MAGTISATLLDDLPPEILQEISEHLDHPSAKALSLVNKSCRAGVVPTVFRSLVFHLEYRETLQSEAATFAATLKQANALRHVRSLEITGHFLKYSAQLRFSPLWKTGHRVNYRRKEWYPVGQNTDDQPAAFAYEDDDTWKPLASVVERLPGLRDLIFSAPHQLPPCLLKALHSRLPKCKLHMLKFTLRSLLDDVFDKHEHELVTSPNLSTIRTRYGIVDKYGQNDWNDLAVLEVVAGLAPALQECHLGYCWGDSLAQPDSASYRQPWKGLPRTVPRQRGSLKTLCIYNGSDCITSDGLAVWSPATDLSVLRQLYLGPVDESALRWLHTEQPFKDLTTLKLHCRFDEETASVEMSSFLESLPPLQDLEIHGFFDEESLRSLCQQQLGNPSLRRLVLASDHGIEPLAFDSLQTRTLVVHCPRIEELELSIQRAQGGLEEFKTYSQLGRLPCLRTLDLQLEYGLPGPIAIDEGEDGSVIRATEEWFEDFENEVFAPPEGTSYGVHQVQFRNGHVMEVLLNAAIDKRLALSIWGAITSSSSKQTAPLQSLKLYTSWPLLPPGLDVALKHLRRSWVIKNGAIVDLTPSPPTTHKPFFSRLYNTAPSVESEEKDDDELPPHLADIMERLWPGIKKSRNWRAHWYSRPLWSSLPVMLRMQ